MRVRLARVLCVLLYATSARQAAAQATPPADYAPPKPPVRGLELGFTGGAGSVLSGDPEHGPGPGIEYHAGYRFSRHWAVLLQWYDVEVRSGPNALLLPGIAVQAWPRGGKWWVRASAAAGTDGIIETADDQIYTAATGWSFWRKGRFAAYVEADGFFQWWRPIGSNGRWFTSAFVGVGMSFGPRQ